jgi:ribosome maturation factor RimP
MLQQSPMAHRVQNAISDLLTSQGYALVLVEFLPGPSILRLFIDLIVADEVLPVTLPLASPTLADCSKVSRLVSDVLDGEGILDGPDGVSQYTLEVSSPGLDRPLVTPDHFIRFVGQPVRLRSRGRLEGLAQRKFEGVLTDADATSIAVTTDGISRRIPYSDLERAQLVPQL